MSSYSQSYDNNEKDTTYKPTHKTTEDKILKENKADSDETYDKLQFYCDFHDLPFLKRAQARSDFFNLWLEECH